MSSSGVGFVFFLSYFFLFFFSSFSFFIHFLFHFPHFLLLFLLFFSFTLMLLIVVAAAAIVAVVVVAVVVMIIVKVIGIMMIVMIITSSYHSKIFSSLAKSKPKKIYLTIIKKQISQTFFFRNLLMAAKKMNITIHSVIIPTLKRVHTKDYITGTK